MNRINHSEIRLFVKAQRKRRKKMNPNQKIAEMNDRKVIFSTLWIFAMFNYLYADVMTVMDPAFFKTAMQGSAGSVAMTPGFLLGAAILMETAIVMVLLSRVLKYGANRWQTSSRASFIPWRCFHPCLLNPGAILFIFWNDRNCLHPVYYRVCMDVAQAKGQPEQHRIRPT